MCPALILHVPSFGDHVFFGHTMLACGILVSLPGTETGPLVVTAWSPNHWNAREFLYLFFIIIFYFEDSDIFTWFKIHKVQKYIQ